MGARRTMPVLYSSLKLPGMARHAPTSAVLMVSYATTPEITLTLTMLLIYNLFVRSIFYLKGNFMKKTLGRANSSKKAAAGVKKVTSRAKKTTDKVKENAQNLLVNAKKKIKDIQKQSSKTLRSAKDKVYATEKEVMNYVKKNPVKSFSAVALTALITGFIASRNKK